MPGKFPDAIAEALYEISLSGPDEETGDVTEKGIWYGLLTNILSAELVEAGLSEEEAEEISGQSFILSENEQGFVDYEQFNSDDEAMAQFREYEQELYGVEDEPQPEDIVITDHYTGHSVGIVEGKHIGTFKEYDDALRAVKKWMAQNNFFPNVWHESDHGNFTLLSSEDMETSDRYLNMVFLQGDDAEEALEILEKEGESGVLHWLLDSYGEWEGDEVEEEPWGQSDDVYEETVGGEDFILTYNLGLGYIGLAKRIE
jgi:hypothetical protein